jgi:cysteine desulfurase/selenocysteine lyase
MGAAADYLTNIGPTEIQAHNHELGSLLRSMLSKIPAIEFTVPIESTTGSIATFNLPGMAAQGLARVLPSRFSIMTRAGFHCAQPLHEKFSLPESNRASVHLYNTKEDIIELRDALIIISKTI